MSRLLDFPWLHGVLLCVAFSVIFVHAQVVISGLLVTLRVWQLRGIRDAGDTVFVMVASTIFMVLQVDWIAQGLHFGPDPWRDLAWYVFDGMVGTASLRHLSVRHHFLTLAWQKRKQTDA